MALLLTVMLIVVAVVIDFGQVRSTRQDSKRIADVATSAGLGNLAPDGVPRPWPAVCSALAYLEANRPDVTFTVTSGDGTGPPTAALADQCVTPSDAECGEGTPTSWAWIQATAGDLVVDIRSGYITPDPAFPEDQTTYVDDDSEMGGCDQLAVIVSDSDGVAFGGAAGRTGPYETRIRSVGRVDIGTKSEGVPAFLMLERSSCNVLSNSVSGSGNLGIVVHKVDDEEPGLIHVDSSGTTGCSVQANNEGGLTVYGSRLSGGGPSITVEGAGTEEDPIPGIISIHALQVGGRGGATADGLSVAPTPGPIVSRQPVDEKYNTAPATITNLHASAYTDATRSVAPAGFKTLSCDDDDGVWALDPDDPLGDNTRIFVDCPGGYEPEAVTFLAATDVVFNGPVNIKNNKSLHLPSARRVIVGGTSARGLDVTGRFGLNSLPLVGEGAVPVSGACAGREGAGVQDPMWTQTAELVIFGGNSSGNGAGGLNVSGGAALCQTFVYLAGPKVSTNATYERQAVIDGTTCPPELPCPKTTGAAASSNAFLAISGTVQWSAPNQLAVPPAEGSQGVEDLALWSETAKTSEIKSGGVLRARGVYFQPNARNEFRSPADAQPQDAQFIARSLKLFQGTLKMQPSSANAVTIPVLRRIELVR